MSLKKKENQAVESLSEISVVNYLRKKRDFFEKNYEILSELKIPHESGTAVSLIEKQLFLLREENQKINKQMCELIEIARQNNELALRMHQLILTLMGDNNPSETFSLMYESLKKNFHADKAVIRVFINPGSIYISTIDEFIRNDSDEKFLFNDVLKKKVPMINAIDDEQQVCLFGNMAIVLNHLSRFHCMVLIGREYWLLEVLIVSIFSQIWELNYFVILGKYSA